MAREDPTTPTRAPAATRVALIANPGSGSSDPQATERLLRELGAEVETFAIEDASAAAVSGADRLAVAGGDGSIGTAAAAAAEHDLPLAVIPAGTANDFGRRLGLPDDLAAACRLAVRGTIERHLDLGWIAPLSSATNGGADTGTEKRPIAGTDGAGTAGERPPNAAIDAARPFVNAASAGLPAPATKRAESWKRPLGALAYAAGALVAGARERPLRCRVECDGRTLLDGRAWQVTVACSGAFGAGSGIDEADPDNRRLDVVAVEAGARTVLLGMAVRLRRGDLSEHRAATHARCREARLQAPPTTEYNVDGEILRIGPARLRIEPAAYRLVVA